MCTAPDDRDVMICGGCTREVTEEDYISHEMGMCMNCLEVICDDCIADLGMSTTCPYCNQDMGEEQPSLEELANG